MRAGIEALGLSIFGTEPPEHRLPFLSPVVIPDGVDELRVRRRLVEEFGIEIGTAFGPLQGRIWRIGTMGYSASRQNVRARASPRSSTSRAPRGGRLALVPGWTRHARAARRLA